MFVREMQFRLARGVPFCEIVQATAVQCLTLKTVTQMHLSLVFWIAIAVFVCYQIWIRNRDGAIVHAIRTTKAINAVMAAYRGGDYRTALQRAESLKEGSSNTAEYCFFRGSMLHHLGKLDDTESNLREGLALETDPRQRALVYNVIASVLMDQERFPESIAFFENAGRAWPDRGANHRGIAEVWLRQGREFSEALDHARQAVEIDRHATGMKKEALDSRLGEDLAVLAWAVAANSGGPRSRVLADRSVPTLRHEEQADPRPVPLPCRKGLRSAQIAGEKSRAFSSSNRDRPSRKFRAARPGDGFIV